MAEEMTRKNLKKENPLVSLIVLNWNGKQIIEECLNSLIKTKYHHTEIIVVDNASSDNSLEILDKFTDKIKLIKNKENYGYPKACNIGIEASNGKYVVTLNNDIVVDCNWLNETIPFLESNHNVGIISCCQMLYKNREQVDSLFQGITTGCSIYEYGKDETNVNIPIAYVFGTNGGSAIYRKSMLQAINMFNESYFAYFEDSDVSMRALINGWKCVYMPFAIVYHHHSFSFNKDKRLMFYLATRNRLLFILNNFSLNYLLSNFPILLLKEFIMIKLMMIQRQSFATYISAIFYALKYALTFKWLSSERNRLFKKYYSYFKEIRNRKYIPFQEL